MILSSSAVYADSDNSLEINSDINNFDNTGLSSSDSNDGLTDSNNVLINSNNDPIDSNYALNNESEEDWSFSSLNNKNNKLTENNLYNERSSNNLNVNEGELFLDNVIINPHFNLTDEDGNIVGWTLDNKITNNPNAMGLRNSSHDGDGYSIGFSVGTISQNIDFTVVDSINFYLIPNKSTVFVSIGETFTRGYSYEKSQRNSWNLISIDTSNINGFQLLSISASDSYSKILIDDFFVICNGLNKANYSSELIGKNGDEITVQFNDLSEGLISSWFWDFGDGTNSTERNPIHTFKGGVYNPSLTVYGPNSNNTYSNEESTACFVESSSTHYSTIQEAIDYASDNDTIIINPYLSLDFYKENIFINKNLTLVFNNTRLVANSNDPIIALGKDVAVKVKGLKLSNLKTEITGDENSRLEFINSTFENFNFTSQSNMDFIDSLINGSSKIELSYANSSIVNSMVSNKSAIKFTGAVIEIDNSTLDGDSLFVITDSNLTMLDSNLDNVNLSIKSSNATLDNLLIGNQATLNVSSSDVNLSSSELVNSTLRLQSSEISLNDLKIIGSKNSTIIRDSNISMEKIDLNSKNGFNLINSNGTIRNSNFSSSDIAINQSGGLLNISNNIFTKNNIGINVENGFSNIHYNTIYGNNQFGLVYVGNSVNGTNNWWGTNEPQFTRGSYKPSSYYDIYRADDSNVNLCDSWLVLNLTYENDFLPRDANCTFFIDLTRNNKGESTVDLTGGNEESSSELSENDNELSSRIADTTIPDMQLTISSNYGKAGPCNIVNGKGEFVFNSGTRSTNKGIKIQILNETFDLPIRIDSIVPKITYVTPSTRFNESLIVEIECDDDTAIVYYTMDGSCPLNSSTRMIYTNPIEINQTTTLHLTAIDDAGNYAKYNFLGSNDISITYIKEKNNTGEEINVYNPIWGEYQGDYNNSGLSSHYGPLTNLSLWTNLNFVSEASAIVDEEGHIYIAGEDGLLYCLNIEGKVIWAYGTRSKIISTPAFGPNGNIYFSNWENSTLYELDRNGSLIWKYELGNYSVGSSITFDEFGRLYVISGNDDGANLFAFENDELVWKLELPAVIGSTPAIGSDGTLYLVLKENKMALINWDGTVKYYVGLLGLDMDGTETQVSPLISSDGVIYLIEHGYNTATANKYRQSVTAYYSDGSIKWKNTKVSSGTGTPLYYNGTLYVLGESTFYALNGQNGDILWEKNISYSSLNPSSPILSSDGVIYFISNYTVYGFDLNGTELWSYELSGEYGRPVGFSSPTLTKEGVLIVPTSQGIYAFCDLSADFTWEYVEGTNHTISFTSLSSPGNNTYYWDFGDYRNSRRDNPVHAYFRSGNYTVYLIVNHSGILLGRNMTIEVLDHDIIPPTDVIAYINDTIAIDGVYRGTQILTLNSSDDWGEYSIYYTVDGTNPQNSSTRRVYYEPIQVDVDAFFSISAVDPAGNWANVTYLNLTISDAILINETLIEDIQRMLDEAEPGSKFVFSQESISGANFTINKPLTIVSNNNTLLVGNGKDPVFTIGEGGKGTTINGFILENMVDTLVVNGSSDVTVMNTIASSNFGVGFNIINSNNTLIKDSTSNDSYVGLLVDGCSDTIINRVNISDSYDGGCLIKNSKNTVINNSYVVSNGKYYEGKSQNVLFDGNNNITIMNTYIADGYFGIRLNNSNSDLNIINNTIYETVADGILFEGDYNRVNVTLNTIDGSFNGLHFNGYSKNVYITNNLVWNMHEHEGEPVTLQDYRDAYEPNIWDDLYGQAQNCVQISAGSINFGNGVYMENNVFIKQAHRSWESRHTGDDTTPNIAWNINNGVSADDCGGHDYNLWDGSGSYHNTGGGVHYAEGRVNLVLDRIGDSTFRLRLMNMRTGKYLTDIDPFAVTFTAGTYTQTVNFTNDSAIATFNTASSFNTIEAKISMHIYKSISWDTEVTEGFNTTIKENDSGYVEGEAIDNPDPVVPSIPDYVPGEIDSGYDYYIDPPKPDVPGPDDNNGTGVGNGTGNGTGDGNGTGLGNGTGGGIIDGNSSEGGNGSAVIDAGNSTDPTNSTNSTSPNDGPNDPIDPNEPSEPTEPIDEPIEEPVNQTNNTEPINHNEPVNQTNNTEPVNNTNIPEDISDIIEDIINNITNNTDTNITNTTIPEEEKIDENKGAGDSGDTSEDINDPNENPNQENHEDSEDPNESQNQDDPSNTDVFSESMTTAGEAESTTAPNAGGSGGSNAYELEELDETATESIVWNWPAAIVLVTALMFFIFMGYRRRNDEEEE